MRAFLLGAALLALTACGSDDDTSTTTTDPTDPGPTDPTNPQPDETQRDYDDVASAIGASVRLAELTAMTDVLALSEGMSLAGFTDLGIDDQHFHHMTGSRLGVMFDYRFHCNDTGDVILPSCDGTENHMHVQLALSGAIALPGVMASGITRDGSWTVRDTAVDQPRVGGDAMMSFVAHTTDATYGIDYDATFDRVRFAAGQQTPTSGKIDFVISVQRSRGSSERTFAIAASLVFAAGNTATLTFDGTRSYSVNLATGVTTKI